MNFGKTYRAMGAFFFALCTLTGCSRFTSQNVAVVVQDVRIVAAVTPKSDDNTAGGAVLGGMIAGTKGAVIGAAAGSDSTVTTSVELKGCSLTMTINGQRVRFTSEGYALVPCSLEFKGDKIWVQYFPNGNYDHEGAHYEWHDVVGENLPS